MKTMSFLCGLILGTIVGAGSLIYFQITHPRDTDNDLLFADKSFFEFQEMAVSVSGTLTGQGLGYPNNSYSISCVREKRECWIASIEQIGPKQIGRPDAPYAIPITKWDANEVVATEESSYSCSQTVLTINRRSKTTLIAYIPINQTKPECAKSESNIRKYTIEDSPVSRKIAAELHR